MKIVQINSVCGYGSTGKIVIDISKKLNEKNIENYILYGVGQSDNPNGIKVGGLLNVRAHQIGTRLLGKHGFYSKHATKQLVKKLNEINPDIIHLHNLHGHYLNVEILFEYLIKFNKKVIWTLHDCWSFTGHCSHFDYIGCNKWQVECHNCPQLKAYPRSLIFDKSRRSYLDKKNLFARVNDMVIVTPSQWLANLARQSFLKKFPVKVIYNGIDLEKFSPKDSDFRKYHNLDNKFIILGVASNWNEKKGYNYFTRLGNFLKDDEIIVMIGLTKQQQKELPSNIISIPRTNSFEELAQIYSTADVFINLTLEEVLGLTNIEALACETPVITFNTGGSPETINRETGFVVPKEDLNELIKAIAIVKSKRKASFSNRCIERAHEKFNKDKNFDAYVDLYNELNNRGIK